MIDPISRRAIQILSTSQHILVPLSELYHQLTAEGWMVSMTPELLEYLLAADDQFEFFDGLADSDLIDPGLQLDVRFRDILTGPLVMLRARALSSEIVMIDLLDYLKELNEALETAWRSRSASDAEVGAELLNLLLMGDMLERELRQTLQVAYLSGDFEFDSLDPDKLTNG